MKKIFSMILVLLLSVGVLAGCTFGFGGSDDQNQPQDDSVYTITYHMPSGMQANNPSTFTREDLPITLKAPITENAFLGWYTDKACTRTITQITKVGNIELYADENEVSEGIQYALSDDESYYIVAGAMPGITKVVIPATYNDKPVTMIGEGAFRDNSEIININIPSNIKTIGNKAFAGCINLTQVYIPNTVTKMGSYVFNECPKLTIYTQITKRPSGWSSSWNQDNNLTVTNSNGIIDVTLDGLVYTETNEDQVIITGYNGQGTEVSIPSTINNKAVIEIYRYAFYKNKTITSVDIPSSVKEIGDYAFKYSENLTQVYVPESVTNIGSYVFAKCPKLTIYTGASKTQGNWSYSWNDDNNKVVWNSNGNIGVTSDGYAYSENTDDGVIITGYIGSATELDIPDTINGKPIHEIYSYAFYENKIITSVDIPSGVQEIGKYAFKYSENLTQVYIPQSVTNIGSYVFAKCPKLTIYAGASKTQGNWSFDWNDDNNKVVWNSNGIIGVTIDGYEYTEDTSGGVIIVGYTGSATELDIPKTINNRPVITIYDSAFYKNKAITKVNIPDGVKEIFKYAFKYCDNLTQVYVPESVTNIGSYVFAKCPNLTIYTGASKTQDNWSFDWNDDDNLVVWNSNGNIGVTSEGYVYTDDTRGGVIITGYTGNGKVLNIPSKINGRSVMTIYSYTFYKNDTITSVTIPSSVTSVGSHVFNYCRNLTKVYIPKSVTSVGYYAFDECANLTIYAGASREPNTWNYNWNPDNIHVQWGQSSLSL